MATAESPFRPSARARCTGAWRTVRSALACLCC
uniref:Uncharacterized protein n=1 Tax=Arundo donax TaxID=35708 RepID=A0A0A8ZND5_ARUDO